MSKKKAVKKVATSSSTNSQNLFITLLASAALILCVSSIYLMNKNRPVASYQPVEKKTIEVADQNPGSKVTITKAIIANPSFIIVRLEVEKGEPGKVIGVSKYLTADTENLEIPLYQAISPNQILTAELRSDDDKNKRFNVQKDLEVEDSSGKKIMTTFTVK